MAMIFEMINKRNHRSVVYIQVHSADDLYKQTFLRMSRNVSSVPAHSHQNRFSQLAIIFPQVFLWSGVNGILLPLTAAVVTHSLHVHDSRHMHQISGTY